MAAAEAYLSNRYELAMVGEPSKQELGPEQLEERFVVGELCWTIFKEMWAQGKVILPGEKWTEARRIVSKFAEHRPQQDVSIIRARQLIGRRALEGIAPFNLVAPSRDMYLAFQAEEDVFSPTGTDASLFLLHTMALAQLERKRVLDAFTGTGIIGVYAAARGAQVVAYDTAESAVACAKRNAARNKVSDKVTVRHGDHTCLRPGEMWDVMGANPPLLPGTPSADQPVSAAVFDPELLATETFVRIIPEHLAPDGSCYLLTSSVFDQAERDVYSMCEQVGLEAQLVIAMPRPTEWYRVHEIRHINVAGPTGQ